MNEVKPKHGQNPNPVNLQIDGYTLHISDLNAPDTRGICVYISNKFKSSSINIEGHTFHDAVCVSVVGKNNEKFLITCIYRSGSPDRAALYDAELHKLLRAAAILPGYQQKLVVGDFNLNRIQWNPEPELSALISNDSPEYMFLECIRDTYFHQHVTEPTRYREGQRPTCDDLLFSTSEQDISDIEYSAPIGLSDHLTITFKLNTQFKTTHNQDNGL